MTAICVCFRHHPVHKSVEFGVQNALKRIFEDVYFQKISEAYTTRGQNVYRVQFPMGWTSFAESAIQNLLLRPNCTNGGYVISLP